MEPNGNNDELNAALAEFEAKSTIEVPQAADASVGGGSAETSGMIARVMKYSGGMIQNEQQANYLLLVFIAIAMGVSFYLFFGGGTPAGQPINTMNSMNQMQVGP